MKINEDIIKLTSEQSNFINKAKSYMNSDTGFVMLDTSNFISINELINWDSEATSSIQTLIDYKKSKSNLAYTEERYINSQGRNIFTFARVGLENPLYLTRPNKFNTLNNFGVKIGLQVPITGNNNFKHSKALIDLREAELEIQKTTAQLDTKKAYLKAKLKVLLANRNSLNHLLNQSLIPKLLADKDLKATISPLDSYDMQINVETLKSHFIDNDEEIMLNYIELLYYQGLLSKQPFINYLSKNLENW
ncbi:MAG: hypothetical protein KBA06_03625 [Saprospiraceae bacterium]|nr:hypothetical protein [Saprospiraceae bacterium]